MKGPAPWCGDQNTWEHVSGSISETEVSLVKQDTGVAQDIGRANHNYSCPMPIPGEARLAPAPRIEPEPVDNG